MKQKLPLVIIDWLDANTASGWTDLKDIKSAATKVRTVGWLLKQDETNLVVFSSYTEDDAAGEVTTIPAPWVQSIKTLRGNQLPIKKD